MVARHMLLYRGAPDFRELNDPPLVWKQRSTEGYFTPLYGFGWRLGRYEVEDYLGPSKAGVVNYLPYARSTLIPSRWREFGYAEKFGWDVKPDVSNGLVDPDAPAVIIHIFTNYSKEDIEASQQPQVAEIIEAARHTLGLDVEGAPEPKWYSFITQSQLE